MYMDAYVNTNTNILRVQDIDLTMKLRTHIYRYEKKWAELTLHQYSYFRRLILLFSLHRV